MNKHSHIPVVALKRLSPIKTKTPVVLQRVPRSYPAATTVRVFVPEISDVRVTVLSPRQMRIARVVALLLVPAIFLHALPRAYADELVPVVAADPLPPVEGAGVEVLAAETAPAEASAPPIESEQAVPEESVAALSAPDAPPSVVALPPETTDVAVETADVAPPVSPEVFGAATEIPSLPETVPAEETPTTTLEILATTERGEPSLLHDALASTSEILSADGSTTTEILESAATGATTGTPVSAENPSFLEKITDAFGASGTMTTASLDAGDVAPEPVLPQEKPHRTDGVTGDVVAGTDAPMKTPDDERQASTTFSLAAENAVDAVTKTTLREEQLREELRKQVAEEFMRGCISFEASGYYCLNTNAVQSDTKVPEQKRATLVESVQGATGNKEIFVVKDGGRIQLTSSDFDNAFPSQDISGEQFVWQGLKGGRWQIFFGTLPSGGSPVVSQVTDSRDSNFNPKVDGDHLVWQGWVDENWEIFLATKRDARSPFAGEHLPEGNALLTVGPEWSVEQLTANTTHDMFPALHGDIVTWQSRESDNWVVYAYSIATKKQTKLSSDGVKSERPSFAITWEEHDGEGGARLMSYDMSTGKKTNLTDEAQKVSGRPFHEQFPSPISQPDQATLPSAATSTATSTSARGGDDDTGGPHLLTP